MEWDKKIEDFFRKWVERPGVMLIVMALLILFDFGMHQWAYGGNQNAHIGTFGDFLSGCCAVILVIFAVLETRQWRRRSLVEKKHEKAEGMLGILSRLQSFLHPIVHPVGMVETRDDEGDIAAPLREYRKQFLADDFSDLYLACESAWLYFEDKGIEDALEKALEAYDELRSKIFGYYHAIMIVRRNPQEVGKWIREIENEEWLNRVTKAKDELRDHLKKELQLQVD